MIKRSIPWYNQPQYRVKIAAEYIPYVSTARVWNLPPTLGMDARLDNISAFAKTGTIAVATSSGGVGVKGDGSTGLYSRATSLVPQAMWMAVQFVCNSVTTTQKVAYSLGSAAATTGAYCAISSGDSVATNLVFQLRAIDSAAAIGKTGPVPVVGNVYSCIAVFPSNLKADAYVYVNGVKYTTDFTGSSDITFVGASTLVNEAVGALKRGTTAVYSSDTVLFTARGTGQIPESLAKRISENPYSLLQPKQRNIYVSVAGGQVDYSLICSAGAYTYTGQSASLSVAHSLSCAAGSYSYSGVATTLTVAHNLICDAGAYTYSGVSAALAVNRSLSCASGSYSYSGVAASLSVTHGLSCDAGSYTYAGVATTLAYIPGDGTVDYALTCAAGVYAYTGQSATLSVKHGLVCAAGAYSYSGESASLQIERTLTCSAGAYIYAGQNATLSVKRSLACATGSYDYIGNTATLDYLSGAASINYVLTCAAGAYAYTGQSATLLAVSSNTWAGDTIRLYSPISKTIRFNSPI